MCYRLAILGFRFWAIPAEMAVFDLTEQKSGAIQVPLFVIFQSKQRKTSVGWVGEAQPAIM